MHRYILYSLHDSPYLFIAYGTWINGPYFHSASWVDLHAGKEVDYNTVTVRTKIKNRFMTGYRDKSCFGAEIVLG
jgi:hypothetical protein